MITLFFSYAHEDEDMRNQLEIHLAMLKRNGLISAWHDRRVRAGDDLHGQISKHLEGADVILLLMSPHFLASDYCYDQEAMRALKLHDEGSAVVIPVIIQPCDWLESPFGRLRAPPRDGKPVAKHPNANDAFLQVAQDIREAARSLGKSNDAPTAEKAANSPHSTDTVPARSSNLRIKRTFSDRDRDSFRDEAYNYISTFFEGSLRELAARNTTVEYRFLRRTAASFTAALYIAGTKRASCHIWLPSHGSLGGDIAFATSDAGATNSMNDWMQIVDDGFQLGLKPSGMLLMRSEQHAILTLHGAAEHFWAEFIQNAQ